MFRAFIFLLFNYFLTQETEIDVEEFKNLAQENTKVQILEIWIAQMDKAIIMRMQGIQINHLI